MICRLCLGEFAYLLNLFDGETYELSKAHILQQHFWFELTPNDPVSTFICRECWNKVDDFHQFYKSVEVTHNVHYASGLHGAAVRTKTIAKESPMDVFIIKEEITDEEQYHGILANQNQEILQTLPTAAESDNVDQPVTRTGYGEMLPENAAQLIRKHIVMICELCAFIGDNFDQIVEHFRQRHPAKLPFVRCCGVKLKYHKAVLLHALKHEDPDFFKCNVCQKVCSSQESLLTHKSSQHASTESQDFECKQCHQRFPQRLLRDLHLATHLPEISLQYEEIPQPNTQMPSKRRQEEPSAQNAKRSNYAAEFINYAAEYEREYKSQQLASSQPAPTAEFLEKEAERQRERRARKKGENECKSTSQPADRAAFLAKEAQRQRERRARKKGENECRSTWQPADRAAFLAKEAQRQRERRARKKGENECRSTSQPADRAAFLAKEAQRKRESRARNKSASSITAKTETAYKREYTSQPADRAAFLAKEAQRKRESRARKRATSTTVAIETVSQAPVVND